jgi:ferredoxin
MYRIEIDRSLCSGMASCVKIAPETFDLDEEGIAILSGPAGEAALEAAECCPLLRHLRFRPGDGRQGGMSIGASGRAARVFPDLTASVPERPTTSSGRRRACTRRTRTAAVPTARRRRPGGRGALPS